jgi:hypothetical protein
MPSNYTIEMWSFPVVISGSPFLHNYLVMKDGNGNTLRELHGGALLPNGNLQVTAVTGTAGFKEGVAGQPGAYAENPIVSTGRLLEPYTRQETVLQSGSQGEIESRWTAMRAAGIEINGLQRTYQPFPVEATGGINSNSIAGTLAQAGTDVTYQNGPNEFSAPGSAINVLNQSQINVHRTANGVDARDGTEDRIVHSSLGPDTDGRQRDQYTRINGGTNEVEDYRISKSAINPTTGHRETPTGQYDDRLDTYENNPATTGNPLLTRQELDPLDIRPELTRTTEYAPDGRVIGVTREYDSYAFWQTNHAVKHNHVAQFDDDALNALSRQIERSAFHGSAVPSSTPAPFSYEPQFAPVYDYNAGNFQIATEVGSAAIVPDVTLEGASSGLDESWLNGNTIVPSSTYTAPPAKWRARTVSLAAEAVEVSAVYAVRGMISPVHFA